MSVRTAANRARIIAWSRVRDDVGLTNQVCALKTGSGIQKSRRAVRLPFQSTFKQTMQLKAVRVIAGITISAVATATACDRSHDEVDELTDSR